MKKMGVALAVVLLSGWTVPSYAQMPNINLLADGPSKTPEEKEADEARDKAYKETLRKIPDARTAADPWGGVRTTDTPKTPAPKATASAKKTRTGPSAN